MPDKSPEELLLNHVIKSNSLAPVIDHMKKLVDKEVIITNYVGRIYHDCDNSEDVGEHYLSIPDIDWQNNKTYFDDCTGLFYYCIGEDYAEGFIVINGVDSADAIPELIAVIEQISLAVWIYYSRLNAILATQKDYKDKLIQDIVFGNVYSLKEVIKKFNGKEIDFDRIYYVCLFVPKPESKSNMDVLYSYSKDWLKVNRLDIICSIWLKSSIVFLCPSHFHDNSLEVDYGWERHIANISRYKREIEKRFGITSAIGIGQKYALMDAKKSYQEAKITISAMKIMGQKDSLHHYKDLGVYRPLFGQDKETLDKFVRSALGPLIEYDKYNDGELTTTLRSLFHLDMKWNLAAQNLYIHVNTLRYRINKINELLNVNLDQLTTQVNLSIALNIMDTLADLENN